MSTVNRFPGPRAASAKVPLQAASLDIWRQKYCLRDQQGKPVDRDIDATLQRVARAIAAVESTAELERHWYEEFLWALRQGAIPAGRILSNAGARDYKADTSTINCTVSGSSASSVRTATPFISSRSTLAARAASCASTTNSRSTS